MITNKQIMTEIEENFFEVFGIEPKNKCGKNLIYPNCLNPDKCGYDNCVYYHIEYPQITSDILLELICICSHYEPLNSYKVTLEELKNNCLEKLIELSDIDWIKDEVQSLFIDKDK